MAAKNCGFRATLRFLLRAICCRAAYIDMDGCLLQRMRVPEAVPSEQRLAYWTENLCVTPVVRRRLALLYVLRLLGVRLHVWTNRSAQHRDVTWAALGAHRRLFSGAYFLSGTKGEMTRTGPCMDDQEKYVGAVPGDLLVECL